MATIPILPQLDLGINQGDFTLPAGLKKYQERQRELERRHRQGIGYLLVVGNTHGAKDNAKRPQGAVTT